MIRFSIIFCILLAIRTVYALPQPAGYYNPATGLTGTQLQQTLHDIIDDHTVLSYTPGIWDAVKSTDRRDDGYVWDMYSDNPAGTNPYNYTFGTDQCGNYGQEGDCYNREHSFPRSWFNDNSPMDTDLNHIFPTDGYVNGKRANYPFGETDSPSWTSQNGSRLGASSVSGFSGTVFEPIDEYKGDFARAHLYMAVRYYGEDSSWDYTDMTDKSQPKEWALAMLLRWHADDPVSQKETNRNNEVFKLQANRNPFIDDPGFADKIWGSGTGSEDLTGIKYKVNIYPNPAGEELRFTSDLPLQGIVKVSIVSLSGSMVYSTQTALNYINRLDISRLQPGSYILIIRSKNTICRERFVKF